MKKNIFLALLFVITSCATITSDAPYSVHVTGNDPNVRAVYGANEYSLPATIRVKPSNPDITFVADCASSRTLTLDREFRVGATIFGNILWILPGVIVDAVTGEMWKIENKSIIAPTLTRSPNCR